MPRVDVVTPGPDQYDVLYPPETLETLGQDLAPGELGWIPIDDQGTPISPAVDTPPDPYVQVGVIPVQQMPYQGMDYITTTSGAPVTKYMQPMLKLWDEGMLTRNPVPAPAVASWKRP